MTTGLRSWLDEKPVAGQVHRHDGRQLDADGLEPAIDLPRDRGVHVVVDHLLPGEDQARSLFLRHGGDALGQGQRLDVLMHVRGSLDRNCPVGAHGERGAQRLGRLLTPTDTATSSNRVIDIFTLARSTPDPSPFTRTFTL
jgi:hypothetical protein